MDEEANDKLEGLEISLKNSKLIGLKTMSILDDGQNDEKLKKVDNMTEKLAQTQAQGLRVCDFCGKTFTNGKALGGHRRYHLQALRNGGQTKKVKIKNHLVSNKIKNNYNPSADHSANYNVFSVDRVRSIHALMTNGKPTCRVCYKDFPSMKSLFGHMRSHPEREWRGVVPPPSSTSMLDFSDKQNLDENFISSGMDLSKSLPSWQKTDKRGRKSIGVAEAAQNLISLSQMNWAKGEYFMKKSNKMKKKMKIKKKKKILKTKSQNTESEDTALLIKTLIKSMPGAYKCGICSKSFTTFQALGGHRSSHNKDKNRIYRDAEIGQDQNEFISGSMMEETHYIRHCSPSEVSQSGPKQGLSAEASDQVFAFDLNEPLVMENEGVEDGGVDSAFSQA